MKQVEIRFGRKPGKGIAPVDDTPTQVRQGDTVIFRKPDVATTGTIRFAGPSPFDQKELTWDAAHPVVLAFDPRPNAVNRYSYSCSFELDGKELPAEGGEMEIIKT